MGNAARRVLTDNAGEFIEVKWDGVRFAIVHQYKSTPLLFSKTETTILNPREMLDLVKFVGNPLEEGD